VLRIVETGNERGARILVIRVAQAYGSPMRLFADVPIAGCLYDSLADFWCDFLQAPDTTA
jgi:hypothetical protein